MAKLVFDAPFGLLLAIVFAHAVLTNGLWNYVMEQHLREMAHHWGGLVLQDVPYEQWLLYSSLGPYLAHLTGLHHSGWQFMFLHLLVAIAVYFSAFFYIRYRFGDTVARVALGVFFTTIVLNVLLTWLGSPDPFTIGFVVALTFGWRQPIVLAIAGLLMGTNHAEQGLVATSVISLFLGLYRPRSEWPRVILFFVVVVAGLGLSRLYLVEHYAALGMSPNVDRVAFREHTGMALYYRSVLAQTPALIYAMFGLGWTIVLLLLTTVRRTRLFWAFIAACGLAMFAAGAFTLDVSRAYSFMSLGPLLLLLTSQEVRDAKVYEHPTFRRIFGAVCVAALIVPRIVVWNGKVHSSTIYHTVMRLWTRLATDGQYFADPFHDMF